jgi:predicted phosphoadenosine phosphosulfate sulfurtransferase
MKYLDKNVYEAAQERLKIIFDEFENINVSFSGGKDSGLLLNLCIKYMKENNINRKIFVWHQDFEAQYSETTKYVERTLTANLDYIKPIWMCLPMRCKTSASMFEQYWIPWEEKKKDIWVRPMPDYDCVVNLKNHKFDFYKHAMLEDDLTVAFAPWLHRTYGGGGKKTISLLGLRAQESLTRWRVVNSKVKTCYKKYLWTTKINEDVYSGYPLYDWQTEDVWTANAKFDFDYNKLYDLFYEAGLSIDSMRVASPFNECAISSLNLYRVVEPEIWGAVVGRVQGANFSNIYGGTHAVAWKNIKLPPNHTWKSFVEFLLKTLPKETRKTYEEKFATSIEFWRKTGGVLSNETIAELNAMGIKMTLNGKSNYRTDKTRVTFAEYPDDLDVKAFQTVPTYKRMAICILKNDHLCKYMGFSQTQQEAKKRAEAIEKYKNL